MSKFNIITISITTVLCLFISIYSHANNSIEEAQLFATWGCMTLLMGIFYKDNNGKENKN